MKFLKRHLKTLTMTLALLGAAAPAWAAIKYVHPSGGTNWANASNSNQPATMATANTNASAGDTILCYGGTYTTAPNPSNQGTGYAAMITYRGFAGNYDSVYINTTGTLRCSDAFVRIECMTFGSAFWDEALSNCNGSIYVDDDYRHGLTRIVVDSVVFQTGLIFYGNNNKFTNCKIRAAGTDQGFALRNYMFTGNWCADAADTMYTSYQASTVDTTGRNFKWCAYDTVASCSISVTGPQTGTDVKAIDIRYVYKLVWEDNIAAVIPAATDSTATNAQFSFAFYNVGFSSFTRSKFETSSERKNGVSAASYGFLFRDGHEQNTWTQCTLSVVNRKTLAYYFGHGSGTCDRRAQNNVFDRCLFRSVRATTGGRSILGSIGSGDAYSGFAYSRITGCVFVDSLIPLNDNNNGLANTGHTAYPNYPNYGHTRQPTTIRNSTFIIYGGTNAVGLEVPDTTNKDVSTRVRFYNNIVYAPNSTTAMTWSLGRVPPGAWYPTVVDTVDHNLYWTGSTAENPISWRDASATNNESAPNQAGTWRDTYGNDANSKEISPLFADSSWSAFWSGNVALATGSAAIDAGINGGEENIGAWNSETDSDPVITSPVGGEQWEAGSVHAITWEPANLTGAWADLELAYSTNNGSSWTVIVNSRIAGMESPPDGTWDWTVPGVVTSTALVRIRSISATGTFLQTEQSAATFNINDTTDPTVSVTLANPLRLCEENAIGLNGADNVGVSYYVVERQTGAGSWDTLAAYVNGGTPVLNWQPDNSVSFGDGENVRVRVTAIDGEGNTGQATSAYSSAYDYIGPTASVIYPNGGELVYTGNVVTLRWSALDCIWDTSNDIALYYAIGPSYDSWNVISSATDNDGAYDWTVPLALASTFVKIKVRATDIALNASEDISDGPFEVRMVSVNPPKKVRDLMVLYEKALNTSNQASLVLAWSAPLKDEITNENMYAYDLRVFTVQPTSENFTTHGSIVTTDSDLDAAPGYGFTFLVEGLEPNTKYWFAIRTASVTSGWSEMSIPVTTWTPREAAVTPGAANAHPFPHIFFMYAGCSDWRNKNCPALISNGTLKTTAADSIARFQLVAMHPNAFTGPHYTYGGAANPGNNADSSALYGALAARIRSKNSTVKIWSYNHTGAIYGPYLAADDSTVVPGHQWTAAQRVVGWPSNCKCATLQSGGSGTAGVAKGSATCYHSAWSGSTCFPGNQWYNLNRAHRDTVTGNYSIEEAINQLQINIYNNLKRTTNPSSSRMFDGISMDLSGMIDDSVSALYGVDDFVNMNDMVGYVDTDPGATDNRRWQFYRHYRNAMNLGMRMSHDGLAIPRIFNNLPAAVIEHRDVTSGGVYEGWPVATGSASVDTNANWLTAFYGQRGTARAMFPVGFIRPGITGYQYMKNKDYPSYNLLIGLGTGVASTSTGLDTSVALNRRSYRFGLGTASMVDGFYWQYYAGGSWGSANDASDWAKVVWEDAWVNVDGVADGQSHGWLGYPTSRYWTALTGTSPSNLIPTSTADTTFETTWPSAWTRSQTGGTIDVSADTAAPGGGSKSVKATVTAAVPEFEYNVGFRLRWPQAGWYSMTNTSGVTLQFWVKTTEAPKWFRVGLRDSNNNSVGTGSSVFMWADTIWRKQVLTLYNNSGSTQSDLMPYFWFADTVGTWYVDRITAYAGEASLYGRHFTNGMVILNPTNTAQTYTWAADGYDYKRIQGNWRDALQVHDGSLESDRSVDVAPYDAVFLPRRATGGWTATGGTRRNKWWPWWGTSTSGTPTPVK